MLTPFTYLQGTNRERAAMEGTRNTKRDSEGSKHQAGTLLPASLEKRQSSE